MAVIEDHYNFNQQLLRTVYNTMLPEKTQDLVNYFALCGTSGTNSEGTLFALAYYFEDVLGNPNGTDHHQNIRNFMKTGWDGIAFTEVL
jgi:hypothetical protein